MMLRCPLCDGADSEHFHRDTIRSYLRCAVCDLVFVPAEQRLGRDEELAEYRRHENSVHDEGYRTFLRRLQEPLAALLPAAASGLDFGCGPAPALAAMLEERGHAVALYDSFFYPEAGWERRHYDFITATEVVEHLHEPGRVLEQLWDLLQPGGWLGVMTKLVIDEEAFSRWHYKRDPTHVCFFSRMTWRWWAEQREAALRFHGADVMLLQKPTSPARAPAA